MFRIGDYIKFNEIYNKEYWYSFQSYRIVNITIDYYGNKIYTLDRLYPPKVKGVNIKRYRKTVECRIILDTKRIREEKIKIIFND